MSNDKMTNAACYELSGIDIPDENLELGFLNSICSKAFDLGNLCSVMCIDDTILYVLLLNKVKKEQILANSFSIFNSVCPDSAKQVS